MRFEGESHYTACLPDGSWSTPVPICWREYWAHWPYYFTDCIVKITPPSVGVVEYCEFVMSVSVCLFMCLSANISSEIRVRSSPNVLCMTVARSSFGGVAICYSSIYDFIDVVVFAHNWPYRL